MDELDKNIAAFNRQRDDLEKTYMGKWVVFHNNTLIDTYDDSESAASEALQKFGTGPYLIRQIGAHDIVLPVSVMVR